ncbi:MAG TPA: tetratricopeptide repeat protein, partial [Ktedonobacterales bacterium]
AREELTKALALARQIRDALSTARTLNSLGLLARDEGDNQQACQHFREALALFERISSPEAAEPRQMLQRLGCGP